MDWFNRPDQPAEAQKEPLRVSELSAIIEDLLDNPCLQDIWVRGEVTNYTHHARGHRYFSLSEKGGGNTAAVIKCVMWRSDAERLAFTPAEGMEVLVSGTVRLYAPHGAYQLQVKEMKRAGLGEKFLLVEQWKRELAARGTLFCGKETSAPAIPRTDWRGHFRDRGGHPRYQDSCRTALPGRNYYLADSSPGRKRPPRNRSGNTPPVCQGATSLSLPGAGGVLKISSRSTIPMSSGRSLHPRSRS